jgi:hypothetical protein
MIFLWKKWGLLRIYQPHCSLISFPHAANTASSHRQVPVFRGMEIADRASEAFSGEGETEDTYVEHGIAQGNGEGEMNLGSVNRNANDRRWATNLRINLDYHRKLNQQLDVGIKERYEAAKSLLFERDCKSQSLLNNLQEGERIHNEYQKKMKMRYFFPFPLFFLYTLLPLSSVGL